MESYRHGGGPLLARDKLLARLNTSTTYYHQHDGTLRFAVSQDGEIQAMARNGRQLVMRENIDVQLAFAAESQLAAGQAEAPVLRRFIARMA
jgi:hypothetical protein